MKNVYYAASIHGGREKLEDYKEMVNYIKKFANVLSEHVVQKKPWEVEGGKKDVDKKEQVYLRDVNLLEKADLVIADVTTPSLGVGYEIAYAEALNIPVVCLFDDLSDRRLSPMISGNRYFKIEYYETMDQAKEIIKKHLDK